MTPIESHAWFIRDFPDTDMNFKSKVFHAEPRKSRIAFRSCCRRAISRNLAFVFSCISVFFEAVLLQRRMATRCSVSPKMGVSPAAGAPHITQKSKIYHQKCDWYKIRSVWSVCARWTNNCIICHYKPFARLPFVSSLFFPVSLFARARLPDGKIWSLPFLGLRQGGGRGDAIQGKEGIKFCSAA